MRAFRLLTIIGTLLALSGQGFATAVHVRSCQIQLSAARSLPAGQDAPSAAAGPSLDAGDCCDTGPNPKESCERAGKHDPCNPCKVGYNCKVPPTYEPTQGPLMSITPARQAVVERVPTLALSHSPFGLWRPPRPI